MNVRPLLRLLCGEGRGDEGAVLFRYEVTVELEDEVMLLDFAEAMHRRWFSDAEAEAWRASDPPLLEAVAEALILLNQNPPEIGLRVVRCTGEAVSATSDISPA